MQNRQVTCSSRHDTDNRHTRAAENPGSPPHNKTKRNRNRKGGGRPKGKREKSGLLGSKGNDARHGSLKADGHHFRARLARCFSFFSAAGRDDRRRIARCAHQPALYATDWLAGRAGGTGKRGKDEGRRRIGEAATADRG